MAKLIIWRPDGEIQPLLDTETHTEALEISQIDKRWPAIVFKYPTTEYRQYGHITFSPDELDNLIQQLTAIKPVKAKNEYTVEQMITELEGIENQLHRMPLSSDFILGKPGPDRDERERKNEERLNVLSEIVKRLVK